MAAKQQLDSVRREMEKMNSASSEILRLLKEVRAQQSHQQLELEAPGEIPWCPLTFMELDIQLDI